MKFDNNFMKYILNWILFYKKLVLLCFHVYNLPYFFFFVNIIYCFLAIDFLFYSFYNATKEITCFSVSPLAITDLFLEREGVL